MITLWGEAGQWAADTFTQLNKDLFSSEVPFNGIVWGLTPHGHHLGHTWQSSGRITLHPSLLSPSSLDPWQTGGLLGEAYARDVLLHEMIHALLFGRGLTIEHESHHNTKPWCAEVVRLAGLLGIGEVQAAPVKPRRVDGTVKRLPLDGHLSRADIAHFPHSLRADSFYRANRRKIRVLI